MAWPRWPVRWTAVVCICPACIPLSGSGPPYMFGQLLQSTGLCGGCQSRCPALPGPKDLNPRPKLGHLDTLPGIYMPITISRLGTPHQQGQGFIHHSITDAQHSAWLWIFRACAMNTLQRKSCTFNKRWAKSIISQQPSGGGANCRMFCKGNVHFRS